VFRGDPLKAPLLARPALPSRRSSGSQEIDLRSPSPAPAAAGTLVEIGTARPQHFGWESAGAFKGIICDDIFSEFEWFTELRATLQRVVPCDAVTG
jgi:hypothetical protein